MECRENSSEESYEFFDNIVNYIEKAKNGESTVGPSNYEDKCSSFMETSGSHTTDKETAKSICEEFVKLYYSLKDFKKCFPNGRPDKICSNFLNYWINSKLRKIMKGEDNCVSHVYDLLESQFSADNDFNIKINDEYIYYIKKNDLKKMNILYNLYEKYTVLYNILDNSTNKDKELLLLHSTECCTYYLEADYMCNDGNNNNHSQFCTQLKKFETTYKELYDRVDGKGLEYTNNFKRLTQCDNNTVSTALIGTTVGLAPLLVGLYKFTPLRQLINSNKGKFTQEYRSNDNEMKNIMLMDQGSEHISSQQGTYNIKYHNV
ncbi:Plasmodium vivax Vir protein, putative [Plasmodium vivax]|nr:Plasmodium vivax Vir protein, putative [Plasmodium vivax]